MTPRTDAEASQNADSLADKDRLDRILSRMGHTKLRLLALILGGVQDPQSASYELGISPVTVYHHLTALRAQGVVHVRRSGRATLYSANSLLDTDHVLGLLHIRTDPPERRGEKPSPDSPVARR
ncbi:ArsR/SmtB family transcription factor [Sinomonas sp. P47F7]|uniref:ArsR/SmtB family transcription factor n=1 Tax=Sinomonas sp. P47F7 TaxID=3410987 RepID=UPI003BF4AF9C